MTTGATGQLGLALPVQGELSGTWGDTVNNGITQYTNIAIAATLTLTNDGAVTLANTTGDATASNITSSLTGAGTVTAQFAIVRVTGTLTTAKVVTAPSYSKTYTVVNAATGGIVTFKASGQTGVSIAVGESAFVYYNGTDYVKVSSTVDTGVTSFTAGTTGFTPSTATTGAVTLAGTLAIANGGTNKTSFTASQIHYGEFSTSSNFTYNGSTLSVAGASVTSGEMLTLQNSGTGSYILFAQPGVANLYFGCPNADAFTWRTFGSGAYPEQMRLNATGLGIGTSSPAAKLQVNGATDTLKTYGSSYNQQIHDSVLGGFSQTVYQVNAVTQGLIGVGGGNMLINTGANSTANIIFATGSGTTEHMRLDSAGNLNIGAATSDAKLVVSGGNATTGIVGRFVNPTSGANAKIGFSDTLTYNWTVGTTGNSFTVISGEYGTTAGTERTRVSAAGGYSVGTTADPGAGAIYATGNITAYYSDARLKTVSGKIENALDKVAKLSGVYYTNNDTAKSFGYDSNEVQVGVLAQDVEAVLPQIVKAAPFDLDENNNSKSGENYKTVQYDKLVPLLIEAINELQAKVKALEAK
jgi:hypothetical protein